MGKKDRELTELKAGIEDLESDKVKSINHLYEEKKKRDEGPRKKLAQESENK